MEKKILGDYSIVKQIGCGTLGNAYLAMHRFIKKQYVIKVLPKEMSSDRNFIQRLKKNGSILAKFNHPNIVKLHNISFSDGLYFIVMDCILDSSGKSTNLKKYLSLEKKKLNETEIVRLLYQVASALKYIHNFDIESQVLVHRGIKLNNILVGKSDGGINVSISDCFLSNVIGEGAILTRTYKILADMLYIDLSNPSIYGLGKNTSSADDDKLSSLHSSFLQSYHFLAPEQRVYNKKQISAAADIYSFGVLAYFLLMNRFPEGYFPMPSTAYPDSHFDWDRLVTSSMQVDLCKRAKSALNLMDSIFKGGNKKNYISQDPPSNPNLLDITSSKDSVIEEESGVSVLTKNKSKKSEMLKSLSEAFNKDSKPILNPQEVKRPEYDPDPSSVFNIDSSVAIYIPKEEKVADISPIPTKMVIMKGGSYYRGSDDGSRDQRPRHEVNLNSFALDIHPVTNEQFVLFLELMGGEKDNNNQDIIFLKESRIRRQAGKLSIESGYAKHPVIGITWYGAVAYARWVGKRLPTEAEWEIAASNGGELEYPTGASVERTQANFFGLDTTAVMSYPPNAIGLYDLSGNVYEWCQDWYDYNYYETVVQHPDNPKGPVQGVYRVLRGGCWKSLKDDLRCSHRHRNNPGVVNRTYGLRCAADVSS